MIAFPARFAEIGTALSVCCLIAQFFVSATAFSAERSAQSEYCAREIADASVHANGIAISTTGLAIGNTVGEPFPRSFTWTFKQGLQFIDPFPDLESGFDLLSDVNDFGVAVGTHYDGFSADFPFVWDRLRGGRRIDVSSLGSGHGTADVINNFGMVGGVIFDHSADGNTARAFVWHPFIGAFELAPQNYLSDVSGINDWGQVVGTVIARSVDRAQAFIWDAWRGLRILPPLPGNDTAHAVDINESGTIVGISGTGGIDRAVLWRGTAAPVELHSLPADVSSYPIRMNNTGQIIGTLSDQSGYRSFIWDQRRGIRDLDDLVKLPDGLTIDSVGDLNDLGWITAKAYEDVAQRVSRVFLLLPKGKRSGGLCP